MSNTSGPSIEFVGASQSSSSEMDSDASGFRSDEVIFRDEDIAKSYPSDGNIVCRFAVKKWKVDEGNDFIGVYKIGWSDVIRDRITSKPVISGHFTSPGYYKLDFPASQFVTLDENTVEFFQFCYVSGDKFKGASKIFKIYRPEEENMVEENPADNEEFVFLRSKHAILQEEIDNLKSKNLVLETENTCLKNVRLDETTKIESQSREIQVLQQKMDEWMDVFTTEKARFEKEITDLKLVNEDYVNKIAQKDLEITNLKLVNESHVKKISQKDEEINQHLMSMHRWEEERIELDELIQTLSNEKGALMEQLESEKSLNKSTSQTIALLNKQSKQEKEKFDQSVDASRKTIEKLSATIQSNSTVNNSLNEQKNELTKKVQELSLRLEVAAKEYEKLGMDRNRLLTIEGKYNRLVEKVNKHNHQKNARKSEATNAIVDRNTQVKERFIDIDERVVGEELIAAAASSSANNIDDIVSLPCTICREDILCTFKDLRQMTQHLEEVHDQRVCPVCSQLFNAKLDGIDMYFANHVEGHFDMPNFPID